MNRIITYCDAINEALAQEMDLDDKVFIYGIDVGDHKRTFGTANGLVEKFGTDRCFSTPLAEDTMTGIALGAAINGLKPIHVHMRIDFVLLAMNQIVNMLSSYRYLSGQSVPVVIRAIVGRGWGQGFQHSKTMHSVFAHIPGLKVVMPTTTYDAKGMLISAIRDPDPVVFLEHRWLYYQDGEVPEEPYTVDLGKPVMLRGGDDITIIGTSWLNVEAVRAADILEKHGVSVEVFDARSASPLDFELLVDSVTRTGKCVIADNDWVHCGFGSELAATIYDKCLSHLSVPIRRVGFGFTPCPTTRPLENQFYPNAVDIIRTVEDMLILPRHDVTGEEFYSYENKFRGPF
jgi:acetoin:2,6-dichlorophenolindophenol oxidoreductase subunit beta